MCTLSFGRKLSWLAVRWVGWLSLGVGWCQLVPSANAQPTPNQRMAGGVNTTPPYFQVANYVLFLFGLRVARKQGFGVIMG